MARLEARSHLTGWICLLTLAGGCAPQPEPAHGDPAATAAHSTPAAPATAAPRPAFDLGAVMRRVHFAYRAEGSAFVGGHDTYGVRVTTAPAATVAVTPVQSRADDPAPRTGAPITLTTATIAREGAAAPAADAPRDSAIDDATGALEVDRGAARERLENTPEGVEQSWRFAAQPAGHGDLTVRVRVGGERFTGATPAGLHFADPATGLGVRYGVATWVDARGARTPVASRFVDGAIELTVPAAVLERAAYPAVLDPTVSPEAGTDVPITAGALGAQTTPSTAFDGTNFLVVWTDARPGAREIFGARVTPAGAVLDATGFAISSAAANESQPAVAFGGGQYLVTWSAVNRGTANIYAARVSTAGAVLDPAGIAVSTVASVQSHPDVAYGGGQFLVAWADERNNNDLTDVYTRAVTAAGALVGASDNLVATLQAEPALASDGTQFLLVTRDDDDAAAATQVHGYRLDASGALVSGFMVRDVPGSDAYKPDVAFGGGQYLVSWADARLAPANIYAARVSTAGAVLDPANTGIAVSLAPQAQDAPAVTFDGTNFAVVWQDARSGSNDVYGARVSAAGAVLDSVAAGVAIALQAGSETAPTVAFGGGVYLAAWQNDNNSSVDIFAVVTDATLSGLGAPVRVSLGANEQLTPAVAFGGGQYLVVWSDSRNYATSGYDIYATRVDAAGNALDVNGIAVCTALRSQSAPAVAFGGGQFLVAWTDYRSNTSYDVYARRVASGGGLGTEFAVSTAASTQQNPAVAYNAYEYDFLIAYESYESGTSYDVYVTSSSGNGVGFRHPVAANSYRQTNPAIACGQSDDCEVVWQETRPTGDTDIAGALVDYTWVGWYPGAGAILLTAPRDQYAPAIASSGSGYLVVFQTHNGVDSDVAGLRVGTGNAPIGGQQMISVAANHQYSPAVAWDGTRYLVVWQDARSGTGQDIYATTVDAAGSVGFANGFVVSALAANEMSPAVAAGPSGQFLVPYVRYDGAPVNAQRVHTRVVSGPF